MYPLEKRQKCGTSKVNRQVYEVGPDLNGVVTFSATFHLSWICYSSSDLLLTSFKERGREIRLITLALKSKDLGKDGSGLLHVVRIEGQTCCSVEGVIWLGGVVK